VRTEFNQFLLNLYGLVRAEPTQQFSARALDLLHRALPFDTAVWAAFTMTPGGPRDHWRYLHGIPEQMIEEYEAVKQYDILNQQAVANSGRTVNVSLATVEGVAHPAILAHAHRWGMEHTLATMHLESPLNLFTAICLYRKDLDRPFSECEREEAEAAVPHLVQAWHINNIHFLDVPPSRPITPSRARGLVDRFGVLHNHEPGLTALFRHEDPAWQGPTVPAPLMVFFENGARQYKGTAIIASLVRQLPDRTYVISVRARAAIDALSKRELAVAREFAAGRTYREIARAFGTSPTTVRSQIQIIYTKLNVRSKIDLARHVDRSS